MLHVRVKTTLKETSKLITVASQLEGGARCFGSYKRGAILHQSLSIDFFSQIFNAENSNREQYSMNTLLQRG